MQWNQFLFPAPTSSYTSSGFIGDIIYVPKYAREPETLERKQFSKLDKDDVDPNDKIMEIAMLQQKSDESKPEKRIPPGLADMKQSLERHQKSKDEK
jgi:hypothetical protein